MKNKKMAPKLEDASRGRKRIKEIEDWWQSIEEQEPQRRTSSWHKRERLILHLDSVITKLMNFNNLLLKYTPRKHHDASSKICGLYRIKKAKLKIGLLREDSLKVINNAAAKKIAGLYHIKYAKLELNKLREELKKHRENVEREIIEIKEEINKIDNQRIQIENDQECLKEYIDMIYESKATEGIKLRLLKNMQNEYKEYTDVLPIYATRRAQLEIRLELLMSPRALRTTTNLPPQDMRPVAPGTIMYFY